MDGVVSGCVLRALMGGVVFNWTLPVMMDRVVLWYVSRALVGGAIFKWTLPIMVDVVNSRRVPRALVGGAVCNWTLPTTLTVHCGGRCCPWGWFWISECCSHYKRIKDDLTWCASRASNSERCATPSFLWMHWCLNNRLRLEFNLAFFCCNFLCIARNGDGGSILLVWNNSRI